MTVRPARIDFSGWPPRSLDFPDVYHPEAGAQAQASHVFLAGNGLPGRWQGRRHFAILETGFGLGHNFLATWRAWRDDVQRPDRLDVVSLELHPASAGDLAHAHKDGPEQAHAALLIDQWPAPVAGLHLRYFEGGRVRLLLGLGEAARLLPRLVGRFDAFFLDGFAPAVNPALWEARVLKSLGRLAAPGATAATWSAARAVRDGLRTAGFTVKSAAGFGRKREMTQAQFTPRVPTTPPPGRPAGPWPGERRAVVIGAGLAGAAVAQALARQGWHCQVLDARARPAEGASGNPAGLFHGVVHRGEGTYQRLHRAAALLAHAHYAPLVREGRVSGATDGLIVQGRGEAIDGYAQALSDEEARSRSGAAQCGQALHLPQAGWVDPAGLVAHWLATPGVDFRGGVTVSHIEPAATLGANGIVRDAAGATLAQAPLIVLASGSGLPRWSHDGLLDVPGLHTTRGQLTWFDHPPCLRLPLSGHGYAVQLPDGRLMCGATSQAEEDPAWALPGKLGSRVTAGTPTGIRHQVDPLRDEDHAWNLERLQALTGISPAQSVPRGGRAQWRLNTLDRLPLIGPLPAPLQLGERGDQARLMRRIPGVFVAGAFGSRGLSWAPLAGELIAGWAEGTPLPLEADLLDAIDPARWPVRRHRRSPTRGS